MLEKVYMIETLFCCVLTLLCICPVGCFSLEKFSWDSQQDRDRATSGSNKIKFQSGQSYSLWGKSGIIKFEFKPI